MHPLVSIIIPLYNTENYISEAINSALNQTYENIEILIIDDGSTDGSLKIVKKFQSDRIKIYLQKNKGGAAARNLGLQYTKGRYIQFLDSDDLLKSDKIELQMELLEKLGYPDDILISGQWVRFSEKIENKIGGVGPGVLAEKDFSPIDWLLLRPYNMMTIHAWLTPRHLINMAGFWNELLTLDDDGEYFIRVVSKSKAVKYCRDALTYYRSDNSVTSVSAINTCEKVESAFRSMLTYRDVLLKFNHPKILEAIGDGFLTLAYHSYLVCPIVYKKCIMRPEIKYSKNIRENLSLIVRCLNFIIGWKMVKRIKIHFNNFN